MRSIVGRIVGGIAGCSGLLVVVGCTGEPGGGTDEPQVVTGQYDFRDGDHGWRAAFADYSRANEPLMELDAGLRSLPAGLDRTGTGYLLQSHNRSDSAFMLMFRAVGPNDGVIPSTKYRVHYALTMASDAARGCAGIGGAPAEGVTLKAGASDHEPSVVLDTSGGDASYHATVDKGDQSVGGAEMSVAGDIGNGLTDCSGQAFQTFSRTHDHAGVVTATRDGRVWLLVGTDSGYEGLTRLYVEQIDVELAPMLP